MELDITSANFEEKVLKSEKPVMLDFWATWCGPCQMIAPIVKEIADETPDVLVGKVNVDEEQGLAMNFGISSIPTIVVIKNGEITERVVGLRSKEQLLALL